MKPTTNDHRTRVTKMLIRRALTDLLRKKPIQSISVKELCESAGINRSTFYTHYTDIYDLMQQMEEEMLTDFKNVLDPLLSANTHDRTLTQVTTQIFQCLKENADICTVTLGDYGDKQFALRLIMLGRDTCMETYSRFFADVTPKQIDYFYAFVSAGCIGLLQKWLQDGMSASAAEVASMAENIMLYGIEALRPEHSGT